eukprot:TRINITY_DN2962_c1_g1_i4.p1 TRINITY_DN2962_c1_g1~~TRINITY_DN2962_c1_g1_i4.p1  ORF type:complete len:250 (-),score=18.39 TRINITY_DN2962_c1_g1_i4:267-1016(-)
MQENAAVSEYHKFLSSSQEHDQYDIILVCPPSPSSPCRRFYCRREDLSRRCCLFSSMQSFEASGSIARTLEFSIPASGDIVFEVLRYAYTGVLLFPPVFHKRFGELLAAVDFLGMCCGAELSLEYMFQERLWEHSPRNRGNVFDALSLQNLLANITNDMIRQSFRSRMIERHANCDDLPSLGLCRIGFATRQALLAKVAELRVRACGGPPPSDHPFVIFDNILRRRRNDEDEEEWIIVDRNPPRRKNSF